MPVALFPLLVAAGNAILGWIFRSAVVKWLVMFGAMFLVTDLLEIVIELAVPGAGPDALSNAFGLLPDSAWWFINMTGMGVGLKLVISAYCTRFIIRRIPIVG